MQGNRHRINHSGTIPKAVGELMSLHLHQAAFALQRRLQELQGYPSQPRPKTNRPLPGRSGVSKDLKTPRMQLWAAPPQQCARWSSPARTVPRQRDRPERRSQHRACPRPGLPWRVPSAPLHTLHHGGAAADRLAGRQEIATRYFSPHSSQTAPTPLIMHQYRAGSEHAGHSCARTTAAGPAPASACYSRPLCPHSSARQERQLSTHSAAACAHTGALAGSAPAGRARQRPPKVQLQHCRGHRMGGWQQAHPVRGLQLRSCRGCIARPRAAVRAVVHVARVADKAADGLVGVGAPAAPVRVVAPAVHTRLRAHGGGRPGACVAPWPLLACRQLHAGTERPPSL